MYILECADGSYYTGSTKDLERRLWQHQNGLGARHTAKRLPVKLVYCEFYDRVSDAFYREKQVQGWSRKKKQALMAGDTNELHWLAECRNETHYRRVGDGFGFAQPSQEAQPSQGAQLSQGAQPTDPAAFGFAQSAGNAGFEGDVGMSITRVRLDSVCDVIMGQAPSGEAYNLEGKGWHLIAGAGDFGAVHPAPKKFTTEASKLSKPGDIILGIRATIGEKVLSDGEYCLGRGVAALRANPKLESRFLWHWLDHTRPILSAKAKGATFKQVNRQDIKELEITLPPIAEQKRIAAILDKAEELRELRRQARVIT